LRTLPKSPDVYGLIHADLHHGNFFVEGHEITAFDFDDSCRHWLAYDLTPPLCSLIWAKEDMGAGLPDEEARSLFLDGYLRENPLPQSELDRLEGFMAYRAVLIYHWIKVAFRDGVLNEAEHGGWRKRRSAWCLRMLE
jgi:Ser/Thr protein kinase RdoA (MazF antagonist)